jgi:hypothetical protein
MSLVKPLVMHNGLQRQGQQGDLPDNMEIQDANATAGAAVLTGDQFASTLLFRSGPGANFNDTTPDASVLLASLMENMYQGSAGSAPIGIQPGASYRLRYVNTVAFIATLVAGVGITLAGTTTVAASSIRDYLITCLNGSPQQLIAANTVNGSAVVTGMSAAQTTLLTPGMLVTGTGIAGGTTVNSVQPGVGVTLSANATATNNAVALTFNPRFEVRGIGQMAL